MAPKPGGVCDLELGSEPPLVLPLAADADLAPFYVDDPTNYSSLVRRVALPLKTVVKSSLTIVLVGMFGVSFSKPPCI